MLTQAQFETLLIPIIYHHFNVGINLVPSMRSSLFNVQGSELAEENGVGMGGVSVDVWDVFKQSGESGVKGRVDFDELYTQNYHHEEYPVELVIRKNLLLNDKYGQIARYVQRLGISAEQKMETDAAGLLNNAFAAGVTWSDGKPLCSATHPVGPSAGGNTYSNRGTSALTKTSLKTTRVSMMQFKDDKGNLIGVVPRELWVPPELMDRAEEFAQSPQDPESGNNAKNTVQNLQDVPWLRLSDPTNWFLVDPVWRAQVANWYNREATQIMMTKETTTEVVFEFKLHYSYGADDWRWIFGHEVAG
jgi:phage major head subunit gpT-like protein